MSEAFNAVGRVLNEQVQLSRCGSLSGGCISDVSQVDLVDGRSFVVKCYQDGDIAAAERQGLEHLAEYSPLRTPEVLGLDFGRNGAQATAFLVLEYIEAAAGGHPESWRKLGESLAIQHQVSCPSADDQSRGFGFSSDNYIGATEQKNGWSPSWVDFFRHHRLGFQFQLAERNGADAKLLRSGDAIIERLDCWLPETPTPALVHGDLWSGNVLFSADGEPVQIDPAVHYAHHETDLALASLFGGFHRTFWDAYHATLPLAAGWQERLEIYKLYHVVNHFNLFGGSYALQAMNIMRRFL